MIARVVEVCNVSDGKRHGYTAEIRKRTHILRGYVITMCGLKDFDGIGEERDIDGIGNMCKTCMKIAGGKR